MSQGSIPLLHPSLHHFRDSDPTTFLGGRTMMNFTQMRASDRATIEQTKHKALFLSSTEPVAHQSQSPVDYRPADLVRFIQPRFQYQAYMRLGYRMKASHDNERLADAIKGSPPVNLEQVNTKMMYFHDFRPKQPKKWMSEVSDGEDHSAWL